MVKFYCEYCCTISASTDDCNCCGNKHFREIVIQIQNQAIPAGSQE